MASTFDVVIRSGTIVDGSGGEPFQGDVAIKDGVIVTVGVVEGRGETEIDAKGRIVTPGFVDIHTHYDGQATWENRLSPSSQHGVTTVIAGNCGIGFAPCRPEDRQTLVKFMEGVEDIPEAVMAEGLPWNWETFEDYLNALGARELDIDMGVMVPHSPLRVYAMGERGAWREPPTQDDLDAMTALVEQAVRAGAIGVSTSRALVHCARDGRPAPSVGSEIAELHALAKGLKAANGGVFQLLPDFSQEIETEFENIASIARAAGRPVSFTLTQTMSNPTGWQRFLTGLDQAKEDGLEIRGQVFPRPIGTMFGLDLSFTPFSLRPSYRAIANEDLAVKVAALRDPAFRQRLFSEADEPEALPLMNALIASRGNLYPLGDPPNYSPSADMSAEAVAARRGVSLDEVLAEFLLERDGRAILYLPASNFWENRLDAARSLIEHPSTVVGLGDGGAHYGLICDASYTTHMLTYWARDVRAEERLSLPDVIRQITALPAQAVGLTDRGRIAVGAKADVNVIDFDGLELHAPHVERDLPGGGKRMVQSATGFEATIVSGQITRRDDKPTDKLPGRLVRGGAHGLAHA